MQAPAVCPPMPHLAQIRGIGQFFACDTTRGRGKRDGRRDEWGSQCSCSCSQCRSLHENRTRPPGARHDENRTRPVTPEPPAFDATFRSALRVVRGDAAELRRVPQPDRAQAPAMGTQRRERDLASRARVISTRHRLGLAKTLN